MVATTRRWVSPFPFHPITWFQSELSGSSRVTAEDSRCEMLTMTFTLLSKDMIFRRMTIHAVPRPLVPLGHFCGTSRKGMRIRWTATSRNLLGSGGIVVHAHSWFGLDWQQSNIGSQHRGSRSTSILIIIRILRFILLKIRGIRHSSGILKKVSSWCTRVVDSSLMW